MCPLLYIRWNQLKAGHSCKMKRYHPLLGCLMVSEKLVDIKDVSEAFIPSTHRTSSLKNYTVHFTGSWLGKKFIGRLFPVYFLFHVSFPWQLFWHSECISIWREVFIHVRRVAVLEVVFESSSFLMVIYPFYPLCMLLADPQPWVFEFLSSKSIKR